MKKFLPLFLLLPLSAAFVCFMYFPIDLPVVQVLRWRVRAAGGDTTAEFGLGWMYLHGRDGLPHDEAKAAWWFRKAADKGHVYAEVSLAFMYKNGQGGLPKDDALTMQWLMKAAAQGNAPAQADIGNMYQQGFSGQPPDDVKAVYWYKLAAGQGYSEGLNDLAWLYATSTNPEVRNPAMALYYARMAVSSTAENPNPNILDTLAEAYYVNQRYEEAVETERRALALLPETMPADRKKEFLDRFDKYQHALAENKAANR